MQQILFVKGAAAGKTLPVLMSAALRLGRCGRRLRLQP